jgi:hypothetical protein
MAMKKAQFLFIPVVIFMLGCSGAYTQQEETTTQQEEMSFFITSEGPGSGANLGGLEGADQHCQMLAETVGDGSRIWRAYLSVSPTGDQVAVNARDRIGHGPWHNAQGVHIAENVTDLHTEKNNVNKQTGLNEKGEITNGRGDDPNRHDILTGSQSDGTAFLGEDDRTCQNWTSSDEGNAQIGHFDRTGGGDSPASWNSAHATKGCSQENLRDMGGDGLLYCFAID